MWIFEQNNHQTSFDDWIKACECEFKEDSMMIKIEEKDKIIIAAKEDLSKAYDEIDILRLRIERRDEDDE